MTIDQGVFFKGEQEKYDRQGLLKDAQLVRTRVPQRFFYVIYSPADILSRIRLRLNVFVKTQGRSIVYTLVWIQQLGDTFCIFMRARALAVLL